MPSEKQLLYVCDRKRSKIRTQLHALNPILGIGPKNLETGDLRTPPPLNPKGFVSMPNGDVIEAEFLSNYMVDERAGDYEFEGDQRYHYGGDIEVIIADCISLERLVKESDWESAIEQLETLEERIFSLDNSEVLSRRNRENIFREIREAVEFLEAADYSAIWLPQNDQLLSYEEITEFDRKVAEGFIRRPEALYSVDPRFFEELVSKIFSSMGFETFLTKRTRDGGRDIIAIGNTGSVTLKYIIECKRYKKERKVSVSQVRELFGVKRDEGASKAIITTTSSFTKEAQEFASRHVWELQLIDYNQLLRMIRDLCR